MLHTATDIHFVMAGLVPTIHAVAAAKHQDVDARQRKQVYAVCAV
jgi:hypothetical protein